MAPSTGPGPKLYDALAKAFIAEGVTQQFVLMGDGNMHWVAALDDLGVTSTYVRHEHCAVSAAMGWANALNEVGVASVTCGPGVTQILTALGAAVRAHIPLVVFAGESPLGSLWYNQEIDQAPVVTSTGARYVQIHNPALALARVREAFLHARLHRQPVVIGIPYDLQVKGFVEDKPYVPSTAILPNPGRLRPDPERLAEAAQMVNSAKKIIVLGGRGAKHSGAAEAAIALADRADALLAETLPVRGLFYQSQWTMGVAGGFASKAARDAFAEADLVIAIGASMTHHTRDAGKLFPQAKILQIDLAPSGITQGHVVADLTLGADAKAGAEALAEAIAPRQAQTGWRSSERAARFATERPDPWEYDGEVDGLDPRDVVAELDKLLPRDWDSVNSSGHCSYFTAHLKGRSAERFHTIREFGAIGNGTSYAMGVSRARNNAPVVLFDGDGSFMMNVQELETMRRHGMNILIFVLNDGAYGSEIHKLRADGVSDAGSVHGRGDLGQLARGFGLKGGLVTELSQLAAEVEAFKAEGGTRVVDVHISDQITSPVMRRAHPRKPKA